MTLPHRTVYADDLEVVIDGESYYPRKGQWVKFTPLGSVQAWMDSMRFARDDGDTPRLTEERITSVLQSLADRIVDWNWTDAKGNPLPIPDNSAVLARLDWPEITWLQQAAMSGRNEADRKNGSSPSTSRSTGRKAGKRRQSGS